MVLRFEDVMTTGEAAELWGKNPTTIKHLCTGIAGKWGPKLTSAECRKSGSAWLVTRGGHGAALWADACKRNRIKAKADSGVYLCCQLVFFI